MTEGTPPPQAVADYTVVAKPREDGWELQIEDVGVTQSETLGAAEEAVRDYLTALYDLDEFTGSISVTVVPADPPQPDPPQPDPPHGRFSTGVAEVDLGPSGLLAELIDIGIHLQFIATRMWRRDYWSGYIARYAHQTPDSAPREGRGWTRRRAIRRLLEQAVRDRVAEDS